MMIVVVAFFVSVVGMKKKWIFCYFRWQSDCKLIGELFLNTLNLILNCIQLYVPVPDLLIVYLNENSLSRLFFLSSSRWLLLFFDDCGAVIGRFQVKVEPTFFPLFVIIVSSYSLLWCLSTIILQLCDTINGLHYYIYINSFQRIFFSLLLFHFQFLASLFVMFIRLLWRMWKIIAGECASVNGIF